jgi:hypothetical protein
MKDLYGKPQSFLKNLKLTMGEDWKWWFIPTRPVVKINYFERLYKIKDIKKMRVFEEDDYDEDKKIIGKCRKESEGEKKVLFGTIVLFALVWVFYLRNEMIKMYS